MRRSVTKICAVSDCERCCDSHSGDYCRTHRYRVDRYGSTDDPRATRPCRVCVEVFRPARANMTVCAQPACRKEAKRQNDQGYEHRFREQHGAWRSEKPDQILEPVEPVREVTEIEIFTLAEIGERDSWVCGLCSGPVDGALRGWDPRAAALAHFVHRSEGGRHERTNCFIAHSGCKAESGEPLF